MQGELTTWSAGRRRPLRPGRARLSRRSASAPLLPRRAQCSCQRGRWPEAGLQSLRGRWGRVLERGTRVGGRVQPRPLSKQKHRCRQPAAAANGCVRHSQRPIRRASAARDAMAGFERLVVGVWGEAARVAWGGLVRGARTGGIAVSECAGKLSWRSGRPRPCDEWPEHSMAQRRHIWHVWAGDRCRPGVGRTRCCLPSPSAAPHLLTTDRTCCIRAAIQKRRPSWLGRGTYAAGAGALLALALTSDRRQRGFVGWPLAQPGGAA